MSTKFRCAVQAQALRRPGLAGTYSIASSEMEDVGSWLRWLRWLWLGEVRVVRCSEGPQVLVQWFEPAAMWGGVGGGAVCLKFGLGLILGVGRVVNPGVLLLEDVNHPWV